MSEFENIQRLIRLKRFEKPEEGFAEDFLREFHQRQRAEMLKRSSLELLMERTMTWWANLAAPKWSLAGAAAAACVAGIWLFTGSSSSPNITAAPPVPEIQAVPDKPFVPKMDLSDLPMANFAERNNAKMEESILRKHLEVRPVIESGVAPLPASANGIVTPKLENVVPAGEAGPR
jgi:hypothetical protein